MAVVLALAGLTVATGARAADQSGKVRTGDAPIRSATVTLYGAGAKGDAATVLGQARTDSDGSFAIRYTPPAKRGAVLYLIADDGLADAAPASVLVTETDHGLV